jgi:hypothetical protein
MTVLACIVVIAFAAIYLGVSISRRPAPPHHSIAAEQAARRLHVEHDFSQRINWDAVAKVRHQYVESEWLSRRKSSH